MAESTHQRSLSVQEMLAALRDAELMREVRGRSPNRQSPVRRLTDDSRRVESGSAFVAIEGGTTDGHRFVPDAVRDGAHVVVVERDLEEDPGPHGVTVLEVTDCRRALCVLADRWYGRPARSLRLIGVTGTNGKTTTASLTRQFLEGAGVPAGWIGTTGAHYGDRTETTELTTPGSLELHAILARMRTAGCEAAVLELSSHALEQVRIDPARFAVGVFTNLTRDHLDYHESFERYLAAKRRLFTGLPSEATAVVNGDDSAADRMTEDCSARVVTYGRSEENDLRVRVRRHSMDGLDLDMDGFECRVSLSGRFNALNVAAAYGACRSLEGVDVDRLRAEIPHLRAVSGRMEQFLAVEGRRVVVDYAHTPDALEHVLRTLREAADPETRIWCVFGCGGDRDVGKRPEMGRVAEEGADRVVVTSDNPRSEDPAAIVDQIVAGMRNPDRVLVEVDRRRAIRRAAELSGPGDLVLVAGRGHEAVQEIGGERRPLDDREEVIEWFDARPADASSAPRP